MIVSDLYFTIGVVGFMHDIPDVVMINRHPQPAPQPLGRVPRNRGSGTFGSSAGRST